MKRNAKFIIAGLGISLLLAFFVSPLASSFPDGLEKVLEKLAPGGRIEQTEHRPVAPLPDYGFPGVGGERLSTGLAGIIGTILVFAAVFFLGKALAGGKSSAPIERKRD